MTDKILPSVEYLRKRLRYDPDTGKLFWLYFEDPSVKSNAGWAGKETFTAKARGGYRQGRVDGINFKAHRIAWALHYGEWPAGQIDHINGVRTDNRICNLRSVTNQENSKNMAMKKSNKSGVTGVYWNKQAQKWRAFIMCHGKEKHLGFFEDIQEAAKVRQDALMQHGFSDRHGLRLKN